VLAPVPGKIVIENSGTGSTGGFPLARMWESKAADPQHVEIVILKGLLSTYFFLAVMQMWSTLNSAGYSYLVLFYCIFLTAAKEFASLQQHQTETVFER